MKVVEKKVFDLLKNKGIGYKVIKHPPVYTCKKAAKYADHNIS